MTPQPLVFRKSRKVRFFRCDRTVVRTCQTKQVVFGERVGLAIFQTIARELREAGTLPRSPRFIWRAGTPHPPVHQASGADGILRDRNARTE